MKKRKLLFVMTILMVTALIGFGCVAQEATQGDNGDSETNEAVINSSSGKLLLSEWAEKYPLQYNSFATLKTKEWTNSYEGHYSLGLKMLAPVLREGNTLILDEEGNILITGLVYDESTKKWIAEEDIYGPLHSRLTDVKGCYECKSSNFEGMLAERGESLAAEPLDQVFLDEINGQIWDCYLCHTSSPEDGYDSTLTMFKEVIGGAYDQLTEEDRVCGQCHNHVVHNPMFQSGIAWKDYQPFKYGFDVDSILRTAEEYGYGTHEEETGITTYRSSHAELEITLDSNHRALGVTCIQCHMPETTDKEKGETYSDHNASQSPLENEVALEYCLSCHDSQGITSTEEMRKMVKEVQSEAAEKGAALESKLADLHDLIEEANTSESIDQTTLDEARLSYTKAKFYMEWGTFGNGSEYVKVVHNPDLIFSLMQRSDVVLDEALTLFA